MGLGDRYVSAYKCFPAVCTRAATWNVEGLNLKDSTKLQELTIWMLSNDVGILCLQETHIWGSEFFEYNNFSPIRLCLKVF